VRDRPAAYSATMSVGTLAASVICASATWTELAKNMIGGPALAAVACSGGNETVELGNALDPDPWLVCRCKVSAAAMRMARGLKTGAAWIHLYKPMPWNSPSGAYIGTVVSGNRPGAGRSATLARARVFGLSSGTTFNIFPVLRAVRDFWISAF
jgi:hypothetical protein